MERVLSVVYYVHGLYLYREKSGNPGEQWNLQLQYRKNDGQKKRSESEKGVRRRISVENN